MELRKLHSNMFKILLESTKVFDEIGIKYHLYSGSMLGAVRHEGFIPWDDDLDIAVKREDYDRTISSLIEKLDNDIFFVQNYNTDPKFPHTFTRVCLKDSIAIQEDWKYSGMKHHIFIDIFPMDYVDDRGNDLEKKVKLIEYVFNLKRVKAKTFLINKETKSLKGKIRKIIFYLLYFVLKPISMRILNRLQKEIQVRYKNGKNPRYYMNLYIGNIKVRKSTIITKEEFNEVIDVPFEGTNFKIVKAYDTILKRLYGNYMELPSVDNRVGNHSFIKLEVDNKYSDLLPDNGY